MTSNKHGSMNPPTAALLDRSARRARHRRRRDARLLEVLRARPFEDLGFARVDHHRAIRQGFPEVVLGLGKTPAQIAAIAAEIVGRGSTLLVTRASDAAYDAVRAVVPRRDVLRRCGASSRFASRTSTPGKGTIVVARPAPPTCRSPRRRRCTAELMGNEVERLYDVGVAGLHRLLGERAASPPRASSSSSPAWKARCRASSSGLVSVPVIAVPTSVGYGASFGGIAALLGMLNSCASGVSVVNIDNGFGAANIASLINHL